MIERTDELILNWVSSVLSSGDHQLDVSVSLTPPSDKESGSGVSLYLLSLADMHPATGTKRAPLQIALHYLITTWAAESQAAHRLLSTVLFKAMESPEFVVQLSPSVDWSAFGIIPRPAFVLQVPCRLERPAPDTPLVRQPLRVETTLATTLRGIILTPDDLPVVDAYVELPNLGRVERTDGRGQFQMRMVPAEPRQKLLTVRAKGRVLSCVVDQTTSSAEPVVVRFNVKEE